MGQSKTDSLKAVVLGYLPFMEIGRAFDSVELHDIFRAHFVERAELFGSAATGAFTNQSDVDILVTFSAELPILDYAENFFDLKDQLELKFGRRVDLVSINSLKNPALIEAINQHKRLLYAA